MVTMFQSRNNNMYPDWQYYCHVCDQPRSSHQVISTTNGELKCQLCQNQGFVEKVNASVRNACFQVSGDGGNIPSAPGNGQSGFQGSSNQPQFSQDPFFSAFGMPLETVFSVMRNNFTQVGSFGNFQGTFPFGMPQFAMSTNAGVGHRARGESQFVQLNIPQLMASLFQNPNDNLAMNQILQYVMENDPNNYGSPPVAKGILETLEREKINDEATAKELGSCAVCTDDYNTGEEILWINKDKVKCGHAFHVDCIVPWLKQHNSCPVCRFELPTDDPNYNAQREDLRRRIREEVNRNAANNTGQSGEGTGSQGTPTNSNIPTQSGTNVPPGTSTGYNPAQGQSQHGNGPFDGNNPCRIQ